AFGTATAVQRPKPFATPAAENQRVDRIGQVDNEKSAVSGTIQATRRFCRFFLLNATYKVGDESPLIHSKKPGATAAGQFARAHPDRLWSGHWNVDGGQVQAAGAQRRRDHACVYRRAGGCALRGQSRLGTDQSSPIGARQSTPAALHSRRVRLPPL